MTTTNYDRWTRLVESQRRGEYGQLTPAGESVFSILARTIGGMPANELAARAGIDGARLDAVCYDLSRAMRRHDVLIYRDLDDDTYHLVADQDESTQAAHDLYSL